MNTLLMFFVQIQVDKTRFIFFIFLSKICDQLNTKVVPFFKNPLMIPEETNLLFLSIPSVSVNLFSSFFGITFGRIAEFPKE